MAVAAAGRSELAMEQKGHDEIAAGSPKHRSAAPTWRPRSSLRNEPAGWAKVELRPRKLQRGPALLAMADAWAWAWLESVRWRVQQKALVKKRMCSDCVDCRVRWMSSRSTFVHAKRYLGFMLPLSPQ
ncbi:hypothetical protein SEVIR_3G358500v4 [Setaria viridis]|uniref:Uncharacterized protein n=1 Tax=Setaria viridis TaxID=4556 RepID=A0A4U6VH28_SETVI|nr:hypothetical protein SEVIR_3G358500v2 [Setaria viridis]